MFSPRENSQGNNILQNQSFAKILDRLQALLTGDPCGFIKTAVWQKLSLVTADWVCGSSVLPILFKPKMFIFMIKFCIKYSRNVWLCLHVCAFITKHYLFHNCFNFCTISPSIALTSISVYRGFRYLTLWLTTSIRCWCSWLFLHSSWNFGEVSSRSLHSHVFYCLIWRMSFVSLQVAAALIDKESVHGFDCCSILFPKWHYPLHVIFVYDWSIYWL